MGWADPQTYIPLIGPIIPGGLAMVGIWLSFSFARHNNEQTIWQKANEIELKELLAKLARIIRLALADVA